MGTWGLARMAMWAVACCGCHAQVTADTQVRAIEQDDRRWEQAETEGSPNAPSTRSGSPAASSPGPAGVAPDQNAAAAIFRVVHDLSLAASASPGQTCGCLAVSIAPADDPRFVWQADAVPAASPVWAAAIANVACDRPGPSARQTSIAGISREGDNVVLTVERVREGTPVMRGALLPRPASGAQLIVRTRARGLRRGSAPGKGSADCQIAIP